MHGLRLAKNVLILLVLILGVVKPVLGEESGVLTDLSLFTGEDEQVVTVFRSPRPISRIAENVSYSRSSSFDSSSFTRSSRLASVDV